MPLNSITDLPVSRGIRFTLLAAALVVVAPVDSPANPTGGVVAAGSASINSSPGTVIVSQTSKTAIINWQTFSINSGELTKFIQPSSTSAVLNRVLGGQESIIDGTLSSNGQVYLINGNGILVGAGGMINTAGFTASTRDIADADFLKGNDHFTGSGSGGVRNLGTINALGGDVILIGKTVDNEGTITAAGGTVGLAAADDVLITQTGSRHVFVQATATATSAAGQTGVANGGTILATAAELRAANGNIYALAINNSGTVRATTVTQQGGDIYLTADDGTVQNSGTLNASATAAGGKGGTVAVITGKKAGDLAVQSGAIVSNGGQDGAGGDAEVSGGGIQLGGTVNLTAPGGRTGSIVIDPATLTVVTTGGNVTGGDFGATGSPPTETNPSDPGAHDSVDASVVEMLLGTANVTLSADTAITINSAITWTSANTLTLTTDNNGGFNFNASTIALNAPITGTNGGLTLTAGSLLPGIITPTASVAVAKFILNTGTWQQIAGAHSVPATLPAFSATADFEVTGLRSTFERFAGGTGTGSDPFQITDLYGLQGLASPSDFFYATSTNGEADYSFILENDIDASVAAGWRNGAGFLPIGNSGKPAGIGGTFNGDNHTISGLTEDDDGDSLTPPLTLNDNGNVGLFSYTVHGSTIENLNLTDVDLTITNDTFGDAGALVANNGGTISNVNVSGTITGSVGPAAGGLAGLNNGSITHGSSAVNISLNIYGTGSAVGGFVGDNEGTISACYSTGNVTIPGQSENTSAGSGNGAGVGGFAGYQSSLGSISYSYATGAVAVTDLGVAAGNQLVPVGGFVGFSDEAGIQDVYGIGLVTENATVSSNPDVGVFAGDITGNGVSGAYSRIDNQLTVGTLVGTGVADNVTGVDNSAGVVLTASDIPLIGDGFFYEATTASGPTLGFPTLTPPAGADATSVTVSIPGSSSAYGTTLTLTATVLDVPNPGTDPTGEVTFDTDDGGVLTLLGTGVLSVGSGGDQATLTFSVPDPLDAGHYSLVAIYAGDTGFSGSSSSATPVSLTVTPKALVISAGTATKVYGSTTFTYDGQPFTVTGLVAGTSDSVTGVSTTSAGEAATAGVDGGTPYSLTDSDATGSGLGNYHVTYTGGTLTVTPAQLTLTASNQTVLVGGSPNLNAVLNTTYTVTGLQNTDQLTGVLATGPTLSSTQGTGTAGTYNGALVISGTMNNTLGGNYTLTLVNGNLSVRSSLTDSTSISLSDNAGLTPTYGQSITLTATLADLTVPGTTITGGTVSFDENGTIILTPVTVTGDTVTLTLPSLLDASSTAYDFTAAFSGAGNFAGSTTGSALAVTVAQKPLLITGGTATKTYGTSSLTYSGQQFTTSGLVEGTGDSVTGVTLASAGQATTADIDGGTPYAITASDAQGSGLSNYSITYADGSLTVNPAPLTITAGTASKVYGSTTVTYDGQPFTASGLITANGDSITSVTPGGAGVAATAGVDGGTPYTLTQSDAQGTGLDNYTITYAPGTLTVRPAELTIVASSQTIPVNGTIDITPSLNSTYTVSGLQNGEQLGSLLATGPSLSSAQSTSTPGTFDDVIDIAATLNAGAGGNYTLNLVDGGLTISSPGTSQPQPQVIAFGLPQIEAFDQVGATAGDANYNELFGQSNFPLTANAGDYVEIASAAGEPVPQFYRRPATTAGDQGENFAGMRVLAHASSFAVANR